MLRIKFMSTQVPKTTFSDESRLVDVIQGCRKHIPGGAQNCCGGVQSCTHFFSQENKVLALLFLYVRLKKIKI